MRVFNKRKSLRIANSAIVIVFENIIVYKLLIIFETNWAWSVLKSIDHAFQLMETDHRMQVGIIRATCVRAVPWYWL